MILHMPAFTQHTRVPESAHALLEVMGKVYGHHMSRAMGMLTKTMAQRPNDVSESDAMAAAITAIRARIGKDLPSFLKESLLIDLAGQYRSAKECRSLHIQQTKDRIKAIGATIGKCFHKRRKQAKAFKTETDTKKRETIQRDIDRLTSVLRRKRDKLFRTNKLLATILVKPIGLCLGGRTLFHAQHDLESNRYADHAEWKAEWDRARSGSIMLVGRKREKHGNDACTIIPQPDGTCQVTVRGLDKHQTVTFLVRLRRHDLIDGRPVTVRFARDQKYPGRWMISVTTMIDHPPVVERPHRMGIDLNPGSMDAVVCDQSGEMRSSLSLPISLVGTKDQIRSRIEQHAARIVDAAVAADADLVLEDLDFTAKKAALKETCSHTQARMLSGFAYGIMRESIQSRAAKLSVRVHIVNPAYTSIIGMIAHQRRHGMDCQRAAAWEIARRSFGLRTPVPDTLAVGAPVDASSLTAGWDRLHRRLRSAEQKNDGLSALRRHTWRDAAAMRPVVAALSALSSPVTTGRRSSGRKRAISRPADGVEGIIP
jgi:IS605 OrfB family transposase